MEAVIAPLHVAHRQTRAEVTRWSQNTGMVVIVVCGATCATWCVHIFSNPVCPHRWCCTFCGAITELFVLQLVYHFLYGECFCSVSSVRLPVVTTFQ